MALGMTAALVVAAGCGGDADAETTTIVCKKLNPTGRIVPGEGEIVFDLPDDSPETRANLVVLEHLAGGEVREYEDVKFSGSTATVSCGSGGTFDFVVR